MHRIEYNMGLFKNWFAARKLRPGIPPVHEQLPTVIVNKRALFPYGYNPSIIRYHGKLLMAYRYHPNGAAASKLAMAELAPDFKVTANVPIEVGQGSMEDPHLFEHGGALCLSYVASNVPTQPPTCVVRWGILKEGKAWTVTGQWKPDVGKNDGTGMEKNWVFYEADNTLNVIYQSSPIVTVLKLHDGTVDSTETASSSRWKWGAFKGGTAPLKLTDGRAFRFFHSRLDNAPPPLRWRYYVGAVLLNGHSIVGVSKKPILIGSEYDQLETTEAASCVHYKRNVVFPAGVVTTDDGWLLSVGINDSACGIVTVKEEDLNL